MKSKSLLGGALILVVANFISKILGAVLKIPLTYILGEEGMAIYHTAFSVYVTLLVFVTSGIPFAVSKYISQCLALGKESNVKKSVDISLVIMSAFGLFGSMILFFGADFFAMSMKDPKAVLSIRAIAPSVFLVATGCIYKSVFEAYQNMLPTAVSQVVESLFKLILGFSLSLLLSSFSVTYSAAGAVFSITLGELIATLMLAFSYTVCFKKIRKTRDSDSSKIIIKSLMSVAVPLMITSVITSCFSLLETSIIRNRLLDITFTNESAEKFLSSYSPYTDIFDSIKDTLKMNIDGARWLFGAYSGYAATVFNLPVGVLASFSITAVPVITRCATLKNYERLNDVLNAIIKLLLVLAIPCAVIFYTFPDEILQLLFKNTASANMLKAMSPMLILLPITNIISASLYASGKIGTPFVNDIIASVVKIILSFILIKKPEINITGVIISSFVSDSLLLILNIISARKYIKMKLLPLGFIIKSLFSGVCMMILCNLNASKGSILAFLVVAIVSALIYFLLVYLFGAIKKEEIKNLYG